MEKSMNICQNLCLGFGYPRSISRLMTYITLQQQQWPDFHLLISPLKMHSKIFPCGMRLHTYVLPLVKLQFKSIYRKIILRTQGLKIQTSRNHYSVYVCTHYLVHSLFRLDPGRLVFIIKTSLKAFSHQRRVKPFNTSRQISLFQPKSHFKIVTSILGQKTVSVEKPLLPKSHFWPKSLIKFDPFLTDLIQKNQK